MGNFGSAMVATATAIIGLALVAVLVNQRNQTAAVVKSVGDSFGGVIRAAANPYGGSYGGGI